MIDIYPNNKQKCCGCTACVQSCPQKCISMTQDEEGFKYPVVDLSLCITCNKCNSVCPVEYADFEPQTPENFVHTVFGIKNKDENIRYNSSSGGAFSAFATWILEQNGVVFGCSLNAKNQAVGEEIDSVENLSFLQKSKYVQSDINGIYRRIVSRLKEGRKVLFVGTPCQAAGLSSFMKKSNDNLFICDFICHGVPSQKILDDYLQFLQEKYHSKVIDFSFRNKDKGWHSSGLQLGTFIKFENGSTKRFFPAFKDKYMNGFLGDLFLRPICYECPFKKSSHSYSDITFADFWGISKIDPEFDDKKGVSLVITNTVKGSELFNNSSNHFTYKSYPYDIALKKNPTIVHSATPNKKRGNFFSLYCDKGFSSAKKYLGGFSWARNKIFHILKGIFKKYTSLFQFAKFCLVGLSNTILSYLLNLFVLFLLSNAHFEKDYIIANTIAFITSVLWSFYWNNRFVFKLGNGQERNIGKTLLKTYLCYGFSGFILNNVLSTIWIYQFHISKIYAPLFNLPFSIPINFLLNKLWAYKSRPTKE